ncbi:MAG: hypothetical protein A3I24_00135 [Candidatus Harrisonbacteria bacterium RIFCSPLOWO2_02_FULL_41_13b]|uniref:Uncharacterized protein n=1 Tax=Candidatus Harrisonbacteria bacterium RIFCSPLOWO2_02_FULL_41_13b TaxID=1798409 RepID=A0A1G1ZSF8_9BACT|nr:MAG: hypothetical protein A3J53_00840 [Candidatus Harrisonbacteria bacterium RIFCSPHIGHO2_02_FULL_40_20]OGY67494.1 MAG: hypothetical protein A3I24_00135 [Candidatus Harrisonbacteria bacterium RIFCSPLOWO2_02_FULL_41_13b]
MSCQKRCLYRTYLAGPMQNVAYSGAGWRQRLGILLEHLRIRVQDPVKSESAKTGLRPARTKVRLKMLTALAIHGDKEAEKKFRRMIKKVVKADFSCVHSSHFIIATVIENVVSIGTTAEIIEAARKKIPIYVLYLGRIENFPHWMLYYIFHSQGKIFPMKHKRDFLGLIDFLKTKFALRRLENEHS